MSFPLEIYSIATRIAGLLDLREFSLTTDVKWGKAGGYADSKLMALLIVACKLGFDFEHTPAWKDWAEADNQELERDKSCVNEDVTEQDVLGMSDEQLDEYMDWVQFEWIDEESKFPSKKLRCPETDFASEKKDPGFNTCDVPVGEGDKAFDA